MKNFGRIIFISILVTNSLLVFPTKKNKSYFGDLDKIQPNKELSFPGEPKSYYKDVFYHIWVPAFSDSDGDGIGDIRGIINKLDYLNDGDDTTNQDLGITGIYLSPIFDCSFKNRGMHGYDTIDYHKINPLFGTKKDIEELLQKAHKRGIRIIFDFVLNHTSFLHPWFLNAKKNGDKRNWYVWRKFISKKWGRPWGGGSRKNVWFSVKNAYYYSAFSRYMPDLNFNSKQVREAIGNILIYWLNEGFDGVRIDGARYIFEDGPQKAADRPKTFYFFKQIRMGILDEYSKMNFSKFMVGEVWASEKVIKNYYGNGEDEFNMCFDFPLIPKIQKTVKFAGRAPQKIDILNDYINYELKNFPKGFRSATFLSNHDPAAARPMTFFKNDEKKVLLALLLNLFIPGTPFLYYGNEIGMESKPMKGYPNDAKFRTPMQWDRVTEERVNKNSLLNKSKELIKIRTKYSPFFSQNYKRLATSNDKIFAFVREGNKNVVGEEDENEKIVIIINFSKNKEECQINLKAIGKMAEFTDLITKEKHAVSQEDYTRYPISFKEGFDYLIMSAK